MTDRVEFETKLDVAEKLVEPTTAEMLEAWLVRSNAFPGAHDRFVFQRDGEWFAGCRTCKWESDPQVSHAAAVAAALDHPPLA